MSFKMYILATLAEICHVARTITLFSQVLNLTPPANLRINANKTRGEEQNTDIENMFQQWHLHNCNQPKM